MRESGFTLIELLIAVTIVSLIVAKIIPDASEYVANMSIRAAADQMREGLARARIEAIKRNRAVAFVPYGTGWSVQVPATGTTPAVVVASRVSPASESKLQVAASTTSLTFNGAGWVADGSSYAADVTAAGGACKASGGTLRCLRVVATAAGDARVCDPAASDTVNGCS